MFRKMDKLETFIWQIAKEKFEKEKVFRRGKTGKSKAFVIESNNTYGEMTPSHTHKTNKKKRKMKPAS